MAPQTKAAEKQDGPLGVSSRKSCGGRGAAAGPGFLEEAAVTVSQPPAALLAQGRLREPPKGCLTQDHCRPRKQGLGQGQGTAPLL